MIQMAIMGFGTIGSGVYDVVNTNRDVIRRTGRKVCSGLERVPRKAGGEGSRT